ncbi:polysaccharide biosynthesis tyrosine autokinase [Gloeocapsa sp. BRSZ]
MESRESTGGFQRYWRILKRQWLPSSVAFGSVLSLFMLGLILQKPQYIAEGKLLFRRGNATSSITGVETNIGQLDPLQQQNNPLDTEAEIIRSVQVAEKALQRLDLRDANGNPLRLNQFLNNLNVSNIRGTDILQISYQDRNPETAVAVVNTLMAVYLENNFLSSRTEAVAAREFIENQIPRARETLNQAELALRSFKEENKIVAAEEERRAAVDINTELQKQINATQTQLADAKAQSALLQKELGRDLTTAGVETSISQTAGVQELLKEIQQVEAQIVTDESRFREDHPTLVALRSRKADLERLLQQRTQRAVNTNLQQATNGQISPYEQNLTQQLANSEARRLGLSSQLSALSELQAQYTQKLNNVPQLEQRQRELERELEAAQSAYSLLSQKLQESRIAENQKVGNARVIAAATIPDEPVNSRQPLFIVTGLLVSGAFAIATALLLEARDKSLQTVEQAKQVLGFTPLGVIPISKNSESPSIAGESETYTSGMLQAAPRSPMSAAYRMLQANLMFLSSDKQIKVVVVTSSVPQEGKSTVSANLAASMAQLGRRVLLVDADMLRPTQHQIWELPNQSGLSNLLVGQVEFPAVVKQVIDNIHVLTAGSTPPNPVALLESQRMANLATMFSENYDFTIIDTPALNVDAIAPILGKMADGVLLVVRPGVVDSASATFAKEFLAQSGQHVLGQVINGVIPENEPHSYYYFSQEYYSGDTTRQTVSQHSHKR